MGGSEVTRWLQEYGLEELQPPLREAGYDDLIDLKTLASDTRLFTSIVKSPGLRMKIKRLLSTTEDTFKNSPMSRWAKASSDPLHNATLETWAQCASEQPAALKDWASAAVSPSRHPTGKQQAGREVLVVAPDLERPSIKPTNSPARPLRSSSQMSTSLEKNYSTSHSMSEVLFKQRSCAPPPKPSTIPDPRGSSPVDVMPPRSTAAFTPIVGRVSPTPQSPLRTAFRPDPTFGSPYRRNSSLRHPSSPLTNHHRSLVSSIHSTVEIPSPRVNEELSLKSYQRNDKKRMSASDSIMALRLDPNFQAALAKISTPAPDMSITRSRFTQSPRFREKSGGMFMPMSPRTVVRTPTGLGNTSSRTRRMSPAPPSAPSGEGGGRISFYSASSSPLPFVSIPSVQEIAPVKVLQSPRGVSPGPGPSQIPIPNPSPDEMLSGRYTSPPREQQLEPGDLPDGFRVQLDVIGIPRQAFCWCSSDGSMINIIVDGDTSLKVSFSDVRQATASQNRRIELHVTDRSDSVIFETDDTTVYRTLIVKLKQNLPEGRLAIIPL